MSGPLAKRIATGIDRITSFVDAAARRLRLKFQSINKALDEVESSVVADNATNKSSNATIEIIGIDASTFANVIDIASSVNDDANQVEENVHIILIECQKYGLSSEEIAYVLATVHHESHWGRYMEEIASGKAYEGRADLGNIYPGDGELYKGRGFVQLTGRANYEKYSEILGVDLIAAPQLASDPEIAARILVHGMVGGTFTGKKLSDYWTDDVFDFEGARAIVNANDQAVQIAEVAAGYQSILAQKKMLYEEEFINPREKAAELSRELSELNAQLSTRDHEIQEKEEQISELRTQLEKSIYKFIPEGKVWEWAFGTDDANFPHDAPFYTKADKIEDEIERLELELKELEKDRTTISSKTDTLSEQADEFQNMVKEIESYKSEYDGRKPAEGTSSQTPAHPVNAPVKGMDGVRDPDLYDAVINQFAVENNPRYTPGYQGRGETYCNIFVWDVTRSMNAEIPHWVNRQDGSPADVGKGSELDANGVVSWLASSGPTYGWTCVSAEDAQDYANKGFPTVVGMQKRPIGHVAIVRPGKSTPQGGPSIAQAGGKNRNNISVADGFGTWPDDDIRFYVYRPPNF